MRKATLTCVVAILVAGAAAVGAAADGGPSPGVLWGWNGIASYRGQVRYVAVTNGRSTLVEVVRVLGGRVLRWRSLPGTYGVPLVAYDGSAGGLSRDGKILVLASSPARPGSRATSRFAVIETRTLRPRAVITLPGSFSFDAVSPDGSTLYLIQYTSSQDYNRYRVRAYDVTNRELLPDALVDRREPDEQMGGAPVSRASTADGRWAYTLYVRAEEAPFVHALDTVDRKAYCIDLPVQVDPQRQYRLRLRFGREHELNVRNGRKILAVVDMEKLEARRR